MGKSIRAEYFNKPITFEKRVGSADGSGGMSNTTWSMIYHCFAHIDNFYDSGTAIKRAVSRPFIYGQLYPEMEMLMVIRYQDSTPLTIDMTIVFKNRRYQILGLNVPHEETFTIFIPVMLYQVPGTPG